MNLAFSHVQLYVLDFERALEWYQRVLGFEPQYVAAPHYAALHGEICEIALHLAHGPEDVGRGAMPYLRSDDFDRTIGELRGKGVEVGEPRTEGNSPRFTSFKDSEGNPWGLEEAR